MLPLSTSKRTRKIRTVAHVFAVNCYCRAFDDFQNSCYVNASFFCRHSSFLLISEHFFPSEEQLFVSFCQSFRWNYVERICFPFLTVHSFSFSRWHEIHFPRIETVLRGNELLFRFIGIWLRNLVVVRCGAERDSRMCNFYRLLTENAERKHSKEGLVRLTRTRRFHSLRFVMRSRSILCVERNLHFFMFSLFCWWWKCTPCVDMENWRHHEKHVASLGMWFC